MKFKILCVEDDLTIQALIVASLPEFDVLCVSTIAEAELALQDHQICEIIMDIELPDGDGLRYLTELRKNDRFNNIPVLIISGHTEISNKVMAFTFGAEDFISKPFDPVEFCARATAKVRKRQLAIEESKLVKIGDLTIDFDRQKVLLLQNGKNIDLGLTNIEIKILTLFTRRIEQVFSRNQIMDFVWGETFIADRTIDSHIAHLRTKIKLAQVKIETVKNIGYRARIKI